MKKSKRFLALLLSAAMAIPFTSFTVFAADIAGTMTAVEADFLTTALDAPVAATKFVTSVKGSATTTAAYKFSGLTATTIPVTPSFIDGNNLEIDVTGGTANTKAFKFTSTSDPAENGSGTISDIAAGTAFTLAGGAVNIGDVIYVVDGYDGGTDNVAVIITKFAVLQTESGQIGGEATVKNPIYNVMVPTTLLFSIDPLQIGNPVLNGQVKSGDFAFGNASNVPVKVTVNLTVEGNAASGLQSNTWNPTDATTGALKNLKMALLGATSVTGTPTLTDPAAGTESYTQTATTNTFRWFDATDKEGSIEFLLAKGTGTALDTTKPANNVAIFQIFAQVETYAKWLIGDIAVNGSYTLQGFKATDYAAPVDAGTGDDPATADVTESAAYDAWNGGIPAKGATATRAQATQLVGLNVIPVAPLYTGPYFTEGTAQPTIGSGFRTFDGTPVAITATATALPFNLNGATLTSIGGGPTAGTQGAVYVQDTDYTVNGNTITLTASRMGTFNTAFTTGAGTFITIITDAGTYAIRIQK